MKNKKFTAGMLSASMVAVPLMAQVSTITAMAANKDQVLYGQYDVETGAPVTQGLSVKFQDTATGGAKGGYVSEPFILWKVDTKLDNNGRTDKTLREQDDAAALEFLNNNKTDTSKCNKVTDFSTISFYDDSPTEWCDDNGVIDYNADGDYTIDGASHYSITGKPTFKTLEEGYYILEYVGDGSLINDGTAIPFSVTANTVTSLDLEGHESIQTPTIPVTKGNVAVKAIVVESEADGTIKKDADGNFIPTGETLAGVTVKSPKDKQLTDELVNQIMTALNTGNYMSLTQIPGITSEIQAAAVTQFMGTIIAGGTISEQQVRDFLTAQGFTEDGVEGPITLTTVADGTASKNDLNAGTYGVSTIAIPDGYGLADATNDTTFNFNVLANSTDTHIIELYKLPVEQPQDIKVLVKDKDTNELVSGAGFEVTAKDDTSFTFADTSTDTGVTKKDVEVDTYTAKLTSVPTGYLMNDDTDTVTLTPVYETGKVTELVLYIEKAPVEKPQNIRVLVKDKDTNILVPGAGFEVTAKDDTSFTFADTSTDTGVTKKDVEADTYTAKLTSVPTDYEMNDSTDSVTLTPVFDEDGKTTDLILYIEKAKGNLDVLVRDKDTKDPIPNANVVVLDKDGNEILETLTDSNGKVVKKDLPVGDYTVKVTKVPSEYNLPEDQTTTVKKNETSSLIFELEKGKGNLDITVRDKDTKDPIPNATVVIVDKDDKEILTTKTDDNGKVVKKDLTVGNYTVKVTEVPDDYKAPDNQTTTVKKNETSYLIFEVEKAKGNLDVLVRDKDTKDPIPNATVVIVDKDGKEILTTKTDDNGKVVKKDLLPGDYTVKVTEVPTGYNKPDNQTATVKKNETTSLIFELEKGVGDLEVIVRDKDTKDPIPNATVVIVDKEGKETTTKTDSNGKVIKEDIPVGDYTIKVTEVPDGYNKPDNQTVTVKKNEKTTVIFELEKGKGNLDVLVRDKVTKDPIPNATVVIVDKDGKEILTTTTDSNGKVVKKDLLPGEYTVKVTKVPDGYNIPDNQKATVKKNETTSLIFELEKKPDSPKTGDDTNIFKYIALSASSLVGMFFVSRKKKDNED